MKPYEGSLTRKDNAEARNHNNDKDINILATYKRMPPSG